MQHKLLRVLGVLGAVIVVLGTSQCKCRSQAVYDTIAVGLLWKESPEVIDLRGLDIKNAQGWTCNVPSENATYFINVANRKTYKFTQAGSKLECQASVEVPTTNGITPNLNHSFAFAAGSMQEQNLYFGTTSGSDIRIFRLKEGTWKCVLQQTEDIAAVVACSLQIDDQYQGCILMITGQSSDNRKLVCKLFDSANKKLIDVETDSSENLKNISSPGTKLTGVVGINPGTLMLGNGNDQDSYDILKIEANQLRFLSKAFKNDTYSSLLPGNNDTRWELFSLVDTGVSPAIPIPMFTLSKDGTRSFYKLSSNNGLQAAFDFHLLQLSSPNLDNPSPSLVIPFRDKLYLVTTSPHPPTEGQQNEEIIYYQAQLN